MSPEKSNTPTWKKLTLALASSCLAIIAAEGGTRLWLRLNGEAYSAEKSRALVREIVSSATDALPLPGDVERKKTSATKTPDYDPHPFLGFQNHNRLGNLEHRAATLGPGRPNEFRILIVGGSVAAIFGNTGRKQFAKRLSASKLLGGRKVVFIREGRASYKQPQQLMLVSYLFSLGLIPDMVLNLDGFNEVAISCSNPERGLYMHYPSHTHWLSVTADSAARPETLEVFRQLRLARSSAARNADISLQRHLWWSALYGTWIEHSMTGRRKKVRKLQARYGSLLGEQRLPAPEFELGPRPERAALAVAMWKRSSRALNALCKGHGVYYVHALQPTLFDTGSKPLRSIEIEKAELTHISWKECVRTGYPLLREAGQQLLMAGVKFCDTSMVFATEESPLYYDACHFSGEGNRILADALADAILQE
jgi:hypothetical protein